MPIPADAPLRRIGRAVLVIVLVYLLPPLGAWWAWMRTAWPKRRKVAVAAIAAVWLPFWAWAAWVGITTDTSDKRSESTTTMPTTTRATETPTEPDASGTLDEWWSTSWPLFDLMNEDLHSIEEAGLAEDRAAMADACYALWGSLTSIQENPPPTASVAAPLDAYLGEAVPASEACYTSLDSNSGSDLRSATEGFSEANELFEAFKAALASNGIDY